MLGRHQVLEIDGVDASKLDALRTLLLSQSPRLPPRSPRGQADIAGLVLGGLDAVERTQRSVSGNAAAKLQQELRNVLAREAGALQKEDELLPPLEGRLQAVYNSVSGAAGERGDPDGTSEYRCRYHLRRSDDRTIGSQFVGPGEMLTCVFPTFPVYHQAKRCLPS